MKQQPLYETIFDNLEDLLTQFDNQSQSQRVDKLLDPRRVVLPPRRQSSTQRNTLQNTPSIEKSSSIKSTIAFDSELGSQPAKSIKDLNIEHIQDFDTQSQNSTNILGSQKLSIGLDLENSICEINKGSQEAEKQRNQLEQPQVKVSKSSLKQEPVNYKEKVKSKPLKFGLNQQVFNLDGPIRESINLDDPLLNPRLLKIKQQASIQEPIFEENKFQDNSQELINTEEQVSVTSFQSPYQQIQQDIQQEQQVANQSNSQSEKGQNSESDFESSGEERSGILQARIQEQFAQQVDHKYEQEINSGQLQSNSTQELIAILQGKQKSDKSTQSHKSITKSQAADRKRYRKNKELRILSDIEYDNLSEEQLERFEKVYDKLHYLYRQQSEDVINCLERSEFQQQLELHVVDQELQAAKIQDLQNSQKDQIDMTTHIVNRKQNTIEENQNKLEQLDVQIEELQQQYEDLKDSIESKEPTAYVLFQQNGTSWHMKEQVKSLAEKGLKLNQKLKQDISTLHQHTSTQPKQSSKEFKEKKQKSKLLQLNERQKISSGEDQQNFEASFTDLISAQGNYRKSQSLPQTPQSQQITLNPSAQNMSLQNTNNNSPTNQLLQNSSISNTFSKLDRNIQQQAQPSTHRQGSYFFGLFGSKNSSQNSKTPVQDKSNALQKTQTSIPQLLQQDKTPRNGVNLPIQKTTTSIQDLLQSNESVQQENEKVQQDLQISKNIISQQDQQSSNDSNNLKQDQLKQYVNNKQQFDYNKIDYDSSNSFQGPQSYEEVFFEPHMKIIRLGSSVATPTSSNLSNIDYQSQIQQNLDNLCVNFSKEASYSSVQTPTKLPVEQDGRHQLQSQETLPSPNSNSQRNHLEDLLNAQKQPFQINMDLSQFKNGNRQLENIKNQGIFGRVFSGNIFS